MIACYTGVKPCVHYSQSTFLPLARIPTWLIGFVESNLGKGYPSLFMVTGKPPQNGKPPLSSLLPPPPPLVSPERHPRSRACCSSAPTHVVMQMGPQEHSGIKNMFLSQAKLFLINALSSDTLLKDFDPEGVTVPQTGNNESFVSGCLMLLQCPVFWSSCIL